MKKRTKKISINLDLETFNRIRDVAALAGVTKDQVISVVVAIELLKRK